MFSSCSYLLDTLCHYTLMSRNKSGHDDGEEPSAKLNTKGNDVGEISRAEKTRTGISVTY